MSGELPILYKHPTLMGRLLFGGSFLVGVTSGWGLNRRAFVLGGRFPTCSQR